MSQMVEDEDEIGRLLGYEEEKDPPLEGHFFLHVRKVRGHLSDLQRRSPDHTWVLLKGVMSEIVNAGKSNSVYLPWLIAVLTVALGEKRRKVRMFDIIPNPAHSPDEKNPAKEVL